MFRIFIFLEETESRVLHVSCPPPLTEAGSSVKVEAGRRRRKGRNVAAEHGKNGDSF